MTERAGLRVNGRLVIPERELRVESARSGGPGGQNVNKVETKIILRFSIPESRVLGDTRKKWLQERLAPRLTQNGELVVHASRYRDRIRNLEDARERLAELLASGLRRPTPRRKTRPPRRAKERRLDAKRRRSRKLGDRRSTEAD